LNTTIALLGSPWSSSLGWRASGGETAAILGESTLKSAEINVETFKGVVQLSGFVSSQAAINKAVEVTRAVSGVKSVKNDMRIK
jgi:osmotically-inducible protein OsmY